MRLSRFSIDEREDKVIYAINLGPSANSVVHLSVQDEKGGSLFSTDERAKEEVLSIFNENGIQLSKLNTSNSDQILDEKGFLLNAS